MRQKVAYLLRCLENILQKKVCPYCNGKSFTTVDRKFGGITALLKCNGCKLQHRHPKDDEKFLNKFYQSDYNVDVAMMTDLPDEVKLQELKASNFKDLRDYSPLIRAVAKRDAPIKVIDYGCSWGYNVYKLLEAGIDATGYELSVPRAQFGRRHLAIDLVHEESAIRTGNDVFFSSHVIEHIPTLGRLVGLSKTKLNKEGIFMAFCPNGSKEYQTRDFATFHLTWGSLHPLYLDIDFAQSLFKDNPYLIMTSDWPYDTDLIANWDGYSQQVAGPRDGYELLIIAKPNVSLGNVNKTTVHS